MIKLNNNLIIIVFVLLYGVLHCDEHHSLAELRAENELSERIENSLKPIVGKSIAIVDLTLKYNYYDSNKNTFDLDENLSMPGLPVAKTENSVPSTDLSDVIPTDITDKNVVIHVSKYITEDIETMISNIIVRIAGIDDVNIGNIEILKDLDVPFEGEDNNNSDIFNFQNIMLSILLLALFILSNNVRNGLMALSKSMKRVKVSNLDEISNSNNSTNSFRNGRTSLSGTSKVELVTNEENNRYLSDKPINVKILKNDEKESPTSFSFLNEISASNFMELLEQRTLDEIALILTQVSISKVDYFFKNYPYDKNEVILKIINLKKMLKLDLKILVVDVFQSYLQIQEKDTYSINKINYFTDLTLNSSVVTGREIITNLEILDRKLARKVKENVVLFDDLVNLPSVDIEQIIRSLDHYSLVKFLKCVDVELRKRFYAQLSERAMMILKEDIDLFDELNEHDIEHIIISTMKEITSILKSRY